MTSTIQPTTGPTERATRLRPRVDRSPWTCANCAAQTRAPRKRCTECGTSRY